ncbi:MAG: c-type cytochrome [Bacteroidetes bacterium]|nr:c-type cytochrome [Bacteroidota bacterium]MBT6686943.1 c-type cytochrome [Bacteroidota bacterium]
MKEEKNNPDYTYNEKYDEKLMEHDYDGIKELNNPVPKWISAIFIITIVFSLIYVEHYFIFTQGDLQDAEYEKEVAEASLLYSKNKAQDTKLTTLTDEASLKAGKELFSTMTCIVCHGANGEGNAIGPNLTDKHWLSGCDFESVFNIIKNGNPTKGMTPFKAQMNEKKIQQAASYILVSLKDSNPENAKEPQGEICE